MTARTARRQACRKPLRALAALAAAALALGVSPGPAAVAAQTDGGGGDRAAWTVLMFDDADTDNIEGDLLRDIEAMAQVGSNEDLNIIALVDRVPGQDDSPLMNLPNFDTAKLLKVEQGSLTELQDVGEVDMGDGETLAWFLATGMQQFPADHYAVFINDHGGGVFGSSWDLSTELANGAPSNLKMDEVSRAIDAALDSAGEDRIDFFGYLACLMATYDAAAKLAPYVDYMAASEEITFGPQADLRPMLETIVADPDGATGADLGQALVDVTDELTGFAGRTQSVIDLRAMGRVTQALESFAAAVLPEVATVGPAIARAQAQALHFGASPDPDQDFFLYDLGDLLARIEGLPANIATARNALYNAVDAAVVATANGPATVGASGMSIFFPPTSDTYVPGYETVTAAPVWAELLLAYYEFAGTAPGFDPIPPQFAGSAPTVEVLADGVLVSAELVPGSERRVAEAVLNVGAQLSDGSVLYFGELPAAVGSGSSTGVAGGWDLAYVEVTDADSVAPVTVLLRPSSGGLRATIPILYQAPDGSQTDAMLSMLLDGDGFASDPIVLQYGADGSVALIEPQPGAIFAPLVLQAPPGGSARFDLLPGADAFDATAFGLQNAVVASGTPLVLTLEAFDLDGAGDGTTGTVLAP